MRRVCVVITARPSYSRIRTALEAIQAHPDLDLFLVIAGSALLDRYGSAVDQIEADGFAIHSRVLMVLEGENLTSMAKTTGIGMLELSSTFDNIRPDVVVTIADRYETIATAVAAAYMNIPLAHVQGGEVSGSIDEKVRHAVTKLADLHFVSTTKAAERVQRMGEDPARIFMTGCPSIDLAVAVLKAPDLDFDPYDRYGGVGEPPDLSHGYIVVMQHPVTTEYDLARQHITETLEAVDSARVPALWFWPNVDAGGDGTSSGIRGFREQRHPKSIHFFKSMSSTDFLKLIYNSRCLVGNSSVGIREGSFLGVPVVNIGSRQDGRERGRNVLDVGYDRHEIGDAMQRQMRLDERPTDAIYGQGNSGERIAGLLADLPLTIEKRLAY